MPVPLGSPPYAVVEAFGDQLLDPRDVAGGQIGAQLDDDVAALALAGVEREDERVFGIGIRHGLSPS